MNRKLVGATKLNKLLLLNECTWINLSRCLSMWFLVYLDSFSESSKGKDEVIEFTGFRTN